MALRVKNIQQGFVDATGFHPIRSSADYDDERTGDNYEPSPRPRRKKAATKKRKPVAKKRAVMKKRKNPSGTYSGLKIVKRSKSRDTLEQMRHKYGYTEIRRTASGWALYAEKKSTPRKSNPLPIGLNWTKAYIRRNEDGDLQALLPLPHLTAKKKKR